MLENKAASRYAKSLLDLSVERNVLEDVRNDMALILKVIDNHPELEAILKNPIVPLDKKTGILSGLFDGKVNVITSAFFRQLVRKGRSAILFGTSRAFIAQYNGKKGIVTADVTSASQLSESSLSEIIAIVKRETGASEVLLKQKIDEKLIGGFILKVGDRQFDASILHGLNKLKREFAQGIA